MADVTITFTAQQRLMLASMACYAIAYAEKYDDPALKEQMEEVSRVISASKCGDPSCNHCGEMGERRCDMEDDE